MADELHVIEGDSPVKGDLLFWSIVGHEGFSRPSAYELTVLSKKKTIDPKDILGYSFDVKVNFHDEGKAKHTRHFQGHAVRFLGVRQVGRYHEYRISLRSWFWLLTKRHNSRIHQDKQVLQVFDDTVNDSPISKLNKVKKAHVTEPHSERHYCVQFQETDHQFLSRLMEEEGIYYWFDAHDAPGTMHLSDSSASAHDPLPVKSTLEYRSGARAGDARFNEIIEWVAGRRFESGKYASQDSQYFTIKKKLAAKNPVPADHELPDLEVFEFPGNYLKNEDKDIPDSDVENTGKVRGKEIIGLRHRHWALTQWPDVAPGKSFKYKGDPDDSRNGEYIIAGCTLAVCHPGYEGIGDTQAARSMRAALEAALANDNFNAGAADVLHDLIEAHEGLRAGAPGTRTFLISCLPKDSLYKPGRVTPTRVMPGPQSAIVVGPKGKELHVDPMGRVKVHFHWDRYDKSDENSTCWVRVSQPWAGKSWGGYFAPRIGQEVIVDFINGDPDRPIIMGRVYNDDQPIPYESPTQSGFKTRSTPNGSASNFNEFRFEDEKGSEQVYLHAEKNYDIEVEADETHHVGHDRTKNIDNNETTTIGHDRTETVGNNETITITSNRIKTVGQEESTVIGVSRTESVGASETVSIGATRSHTVGATDTLTVGGARTELIGGALTQTVGAAATHNIGAAFTQVVGGPITVTAGGPTTFLANGGFTIIAPGGTKVFDQTLDQFGGVVKEGYGMSFTINLAKLSLDNAVMAINGVKIESTGIKMDKTMFDLLDKDCELKKSEALIGVFPGVALTMAAAKLFL
ncbi:type VI secretion system Vgr family protein [Ottowia sp. VDI28]|uniref:type VI secretion system Vgr family protein n=1 Tax=Ottowia sp. VDI28 TaxID=3133968 RepID=UPI003C2BAF69